MKIILQCIFLSSMLLLNGCSSFGVGTRAPAQEANSEIFNTIFNFASTEEGSTNFEDEMKEFVTNQFGTDTQTEEEKMARKVFGQLVATPSLPDGALIKIEMEIDTVLGKPTFKILHTPNAFKDQIATYSAMDFITKLISSEILPTAAFFEMFYNAKSGDPIALDNFLKVRASDANIYNFNENQQSIFTSEKYQAYKLKVERMRDSLKADIKLLKTNRAAARAQRKIQLELLDKAPEGQQFRAMVAKGDRKGAAEVLRKYLPWESMAAFEARFWKNYLDIMANPVPLEQRVFIYRGLNDDFIHKAAVEGADLSTDEAILKGKAFIMSSVMVKNQGSWNRRLRSLEAMNQKVIGTYNGKDIYAQSARITTMFLNHSGDPMGSPFISFSPKFSVADSFGQERVSAYLVDPRLLSFNYASGFDNEAEYLIPLTTFPDELVGIADKQLSPEFADTRNVYLDQKLEAMITREYGAAKKEKVLTKIKKNSFQFFTHAQSELIDVPGKNPAASNITFYKKFLKNNDPKPVLTPQGDLRCMDLLALFWKAI